MEFIISPSASDFKLATDLINEIPTKLICMIMGSVQVIITSCNYVYS